MAPSLCLKMIDMFVCILNKFSITWVKISPYLLLNLCNSVALLYTTANSVFIPHVGSFISTCLEKRKGVEIRK